MCVVEFLLFVFHSGVSIYGNVEIFLSFFFLNVGCALFCFSIQVLPVH